MSSVTLGKLCSSSTPARKVRLPGKRMRDSAYPAIDEMSSTTSEVDREKMSVLMVSGMIGGLNRNASTVSGAQRKRQFSSVNAPIGVSPSMRGKNEPYSSQP